VGTPKASRLRRRGVDPNAAADVKIDSGPSGPTTTRPQRLCLLQPSRAPLPVPDRHRRLQPAAPLIARGVPKLPPLASKSAPQMKPGNVDPSPPSAPSRFRQPRRAVRRSTPGPQPYQRTRHPSFAFSTSRARLPCGSAPPPLPPSAPPTPPRAPTAPTPSQSAPQMKAATLTRAPPTLLHDRHRCAAEDETIELRALRRTTPRPRGFAISKRAGRRLPVPIDSAAFAPCSSPLQPPRAARRPPLLRKVRATDEAEQR
jgi:hypothetical protein